MDFRDIIDAVDGAVVESLGEDVVFKPHGEDEQSVRAIFDDADVVVSQGIEVSDLKPKPTLFIKLSAFDVRPKNKDRFVIRDVTYSVEELNEDGHGGAVITLYKPNE